MYRQSEQKRSFFAIANSLFHKSKSEKQRIIENYRARSEANSLRVASLFAIANFALGIYMPGLGSASFPFKFSFYGSFFLNSLAKPLILSGLRKSFLFLTLFLSTDLRKKNPFLFPFHNMKGLRKKLRKCLKILPIILSKTLKIKENFRKLRKTYFL